MVCSLGTFLTWPCHTYGLFTRHISDVAVPYLWFVHSAHFGRVRALLMVCALGTFLPWPCHTYGLNTLHRAADTYSSLPPSLTVYPCTALLMVCALGTFLTWPCPTYGLFTR